jgi:putative phosphoesterase
MRIAFISDIHGNMFALESVLANLEREPLDQIVCLGDVVFGPQPHEALARVRDLGCPVIMGNWDYRTVHGFPPPDDPDDEVQAKLLDIATWWAELLTDEDRAFVDKFEPTRRIELDDTSILCFHGSPHSFDDWIFATTPDEELNKMFAGNEATVLVGGHTHVQMMRRWEESIIINPGSVGQPFQHWWPKNVRVAHWAEYGILDVQGADLRVDLCRTAFDVESLLRLCLESGMPHAQWWIESWSEAADARTLETPSLPPARREPDPTRSRATTA